MTRRVMAATVLAATTLTLAAPAFADHHEQADGCDHGNSSKPCRPDPQPDHGKDCDKHGNHGGTNEDHCSPTPTAIPTTVTPSPTTTGGTPSATTTSGTTSPSPTSSEPTTTSPTTSTTATSGTSSTSPTTGPSATSSTPSNASSAPSTRGTKPSVDLPASPRRSVPSTTAAPPELALTGARSALAALGVVLLGAAGVAYGARRRIGAHR